MTALRRPAVGGDAFPGVDGLLEMAFAKPAEGEFHDYSFAGASRC